ncbi:hypothetical protein BC834DRAFT_892703 [Gloeopeniophorella convolvens]|nr:hypothetical protein BC834DRAFT_892703 [Gloeopeniophorella convolvens]
MSTLLAPATPVGEEHIMAQVPQLYLLPISPRPLAISRPRPLVSPGSTIMNAESSPVRPWSACHIGVAIYHNRRQKWSPAALIISDHQRFEGRALCASATIGPNGWDYSWTDAVPSNLHDQPTSLVGIVHVATAPMHAHELRLKVDEHNSTLDLGACFSDALYDKGEAFVLLTLRRLYGWNVVDLPIAKLLSAHFFADAQARLASAAKSCRLRTAITPRIPPLVIAL